jgi:hypothetical protein
MANEFKVKNGLIVDAGGIQITGSIVGQNGITGSIAATNNVISGSSQIALLGYAITGSNSFNGSQSITGSIVASGDITGSNIRGTGTIFGSNLGWGGQISSNGGEIRIQQTSYRNGNQISFQYSHNTDSNGSRDLGFRRNNTGSLEIYDGVTAGSYRDLILRNITGSNATLTNGVAIGQLSAPTLSSAVTSSAIGGTIPAGTYYYKVTALDYYSKETTSSNEVSTTVTGSTSTITISWAVVAGASSYKIYRSTTSNVYGSYVLVSGVNTKNFTDTNQAVTSGSIPSVNNSSYGFLDASQLRTNNITLVNGGIGQVASLTFEKSTDGAAINVVEYASDQTMFEFKTTDNPDGSSDFFHWFTGDYQNPSSGWKPLKLTNFTNQFVAQNTNFWSSFNLPSNTGYYTTNPDTLANAVIKADPYTSNSYNLIKDSGTGTGTLNVEISGFTGTSMRTYWVSIASPTTFDWGINSQTYGTTLGTGVTITGAFQTLDNGVQIKLSASGQVAGDRWAFRAFPTPKFVIGKSTTGNAPFDLLGNGLITGSLGITGSLLVTGSVNITGSLTASLQKGYTWVGDGNNISVLVATSSFAGGSTDLSQLNTFTASAAIRLTNLETTSASVNISVTNINTFTASNANNSLNTYTGSISDPKFISIGASTASLNSFTSSAVLRLTNLESTSASVNGHIADINSKTGSYARTNSTNTFNGTQIISGALYITQDLVVLGSSSIQNISSSNLVIGTSYVTLNTFSPSSRFAGLNFIDSGSAGLSGSLYYDSVDDEIVFVHKGNGTNITSSHVVLGPETYDNLGNETYLAVNRIPKVTNYEHIGNSNISDTGTEISLNSLTSVTGSFVATAGITGSIRATNGVVSGSTQISLAGTSDYTSLFGGIAASTSSLNTLTASLATAYEGRASATKTIFSGSSQISIAATSDYTSLFGGIASATASLNAFSASENAKNNTLATLTGSIETKFAAFGASTSSLNAYTASIDSRFSALQASTASLNVYTQSNDTVNNTQNARLTALENSTGSSYFVSQSVYLINNYTGSDAISQSVTNARLTSLEIASSSLQSFTSSQNTKNSTLALYTGSVDTKWSNLAVYTGSIDTKFLAVQSTTNSLNLYTASVLTALTASGVNLTANGALLVTLDITGSTFRGAIRATNGVVSGSVQIDGSALGSNKTITIGSTSITLGGTATTIAGLTSVTSTGFTGSLTGNASTATTLQTARNINGTSFNGSADITIANLVSGSSQITLSSTTGFGTYINQAVLTTSSPTFNAISCTSLTETSSERYKENIIQLNGSLNKVLNLRGVSYSRKENGTNEIGLIAEEVQKIIPEIITYDDNNQPDSVSYGRLSALLIEAMKEQHKQIQQLKAEIELLKNKLNGN